MKIAQVGTFDLDNLGDLLFPWVTSRLIKLVCESGCELEFKCYSPSSDVISIYSDQVPYAPISQLDIDDKSGAFDFILIGGGDLIRDDDYSLYSVYEGRSSDLTFTQILSPTRTPDVRLALLAVGLPYEIDEDFSIFLENSFSRMVSASVRDERSARLLKEFSNVTSSIVPDFVHSIPYFLSKEACKSVADALIGKYDDGYYCFQGHKDVCGSIGNTVKFLKNIEEKTGKPFVLIEIGGCLGDTEYLRDLSLITGYRFVSRENFPLISLEQKVSVLGNCSGFIGSSLHGNIISNSYGIDNFSYVGKYSHKIREYFSTESNGILFPDFEQCESSIEIIVATFMSDSSNKVSLAESKHQQILSFLVELFRTKKSDDFRFSQRLDRLYKSSHGKKSMHVALQDVILQSEKTNAVEQIEYRDKLIEELEALLVAEKKNAVDQIHYRDLLVLDIDALLSAEKENAFLQITHRDKIIEELKTQLLNRQPRNKE